MILAEEMEMLGDLGFWGVLIGIFGIAGTAFGIYATLKHRNRKTASIWYKNSVLLAESGSILPEEVTIQFAGKPISHLKKMNIVFWNAGNVTIDETDIVRGNSLRIALEGEIEVFKVSVAAQSKPANGANVYDFDAFKNEVGVGFAYLDAGQGMNVEVLYQGENIRPNLYGNIKGIPQGIVDINKKYPTKADKVVLNFTKIAWCLGVLYFVIVASFSFTILFQINKKERANVQMDWLNEDALQVFAVYGILSMLIVSVFLLVYIGITYWQRNRIFPDHLLV